MKQLYRNEKVFDYCYLLLPALVVSKFCCFQSYDFRKGFQSKFENLVLYNLQCYA